MDRMVEARGAVRVVASIARVVIRARGRTADEVLGVLEVIEGIARDAAEVIQIIRETERQRSCVGRGSNDFLMMRRRIVRSGGTTYRSAIVESPVDSSRSRSIVDAVVGVHRSRRPLRGKSD